MSIEVNFFNNYLLSSIVLVYMYYVYTIRCEERPINNFSIFFDLKLYFTYLMNL